MNRHILLTVALFGGLYTCARAQVGSIDTSFGPVDSTSFLGARSIVAQTDGKILLAGYSSFTTNGFYTLGNIARFNADGTIDATFGSDGMNTTSYPNSIAVQADGKVVAGGGFTSDEPHGTITRFNVDGSIDTAFGAANFDANGHVDFIAVQADGKILLTGYFGTVSDSSGIYTRSRIARLNTDGTIDTAFGADGKGFSSAVHGIAIQADGKILAVGRFTSVSDANGTYTRNCIARLNIDGSVDTTFGTDGHGTNGPVRTIAVQADGKILLGGEFTSVSDVGGSYNRDRIARLNIDGSVDTAFGTEGMGADDIVYAVAVQADGKIPVAGRFTSLSDSNGIYNRSGIARLNIDGTIDTVFGAEGKGANQTVNSFAIQGDGKILLAGSFNSVSDDNGTHDYRYIARLENQAAISRTLMPDASRLLWLRGGTAPEAVRVTVDVSTDLGATYAPLGNAVRVSGGWELADSTIPEVSMLRLRAFILNGSRNPGIVETSIEITPANPPSLTLGGRSRFMTGRGHITLRGSTSDPDGDVVSVRYIDDRERGKRWRIARGTTSWSAEVVLKRGRNAIKIRAHDSQNATSSIKRVTVIKL